MAQRTLSGTTESAASAQNRQENQDLPANQVDASSAPGYPDPRKFIFIKGARMHNLKNIDVTIPRRKLVVITGLSGSGKSSLAFDTLYADGQRRYVESLSAYARQFLGRMSKPDVDYITGVSPAIAIEQRVNSRNPRSTVGTSTEIYEYLKLLFARIGRTFSPVSGAEVRRHTVTDIVQWSEELEPGTRFIITAPMVLNNNRSLQTHLEVMIQQGFSRLWCKGEIVRIDDFNPSGSCPTDQIKVMIDRLIAGENGGSDNRLSDAVQTAFFEGKGECHIIVDHGDHHHMHIFSNRFEQDGIIFEEPSVNLFTFNNPYGACKNCEGFGSVIGIDENLVIPDHTLSVYSEAVACWKGEKMSEWKDALVMNADKAGFPIHKPYHDLSEEHKSMLWNGTSWFEGIFDFFKYVESQTYKIQYRVMLARYRGKTVCPECRGTRLRKDANHVKVHGKSITDMVLMPVSGLLQFFRDWEPPEHERRIASRLITEISNRLTFLEDVGLGYLTLNRTSNSLSGGESQRINLATSLGSSLVGSMYILDEPSIGLHPRDTHKLMRVLKQLRDIGNTVIVVEHEEEVIRQADHIIDMGPDAGRFGGELMFSGTFDELLQAETHTGRCLREDFMLPLETVPRKWNDAIEIKGARQHNLKNINVAIPLGVITVVTGVSGSGKTSLVKDILYPALKRHYGGYTEKAGRFGTLAGDLHRLEDVELIDQNPIGKSSRSNPATYIKVYDEIRTLYASQSLAKLRGYKPGFFSFNVEGGRCETCQGEGTVSVEMQFMADIQLVCEECNGKRFKEEVLEIHVAEKNIFELLEMSVDEAIEFFSGVTGSSAAVKKILEKLSVLQEVGLGYIQLGQSSSTLSGGEAQRIKLAYFLTKGVTDRKTLFIFDEPTTGLHLHDITKLKKSFDALIARGHTLVIIEHNTEIIRSADWIIDLGPEGGDEGGHLVYAGTIEGLTHCQESHTGRFLAQKIQTKI
ncbi:MAG: excinuclease ABC subunit UvrA [Bacteroidales bacterium]